MKVVHSTFDRLIAGELSQPTSSVLNQENDVSEVPSTVMESASTVLNEMNLPVASDEIEACKGPDVNISDDDKRIDRDDTNIALVTPTEDESIKQSTDADSNHNIESSVYESEDKHINQCMACMNDIVDNFDALFFRVATVRRHNFPTGSPSDVIPLEALTNEQCSKISCIAKLLAKIHTYFLWHPLCNEQTGKDLWPDQHARSHVATIDCDPKVSRNCECNNFGEVEYSPSKKSSATVSASSSTSSRPTQRQLNLLRDYLVIELNRSEKLDLEKREMEEELVKKNDELLELREYKQKFFNLREQMKSEQKKKQQLMQELRAQPHEQSKKSTCTSEKSVSQRTAVASHAGPSNAHSCGAANVKSRDGFDPLSYIHKFVRKKFNGEPFFGLIISYDERNDYFQIVYEDCDYEDMSKEEMLITFWKERVPKARSESCHKHAETVKKLPGVWNRKQTEAIPPSASTAPAAAEAAEAAEAPTTAEADFSADSSVSASSGAAPEASASTAASVDGSAETTSSAESNSKSSKGRNKRQKESDSGINKDVEYEPQHHADASANLHRGKLMATLAASNFIVDMDMNTSDVIDVSMNSKDSMTDLFLDEKRLAQLFNMEKKKRKHTPNELDGHSNTGSSNDPPKKQGRLQRNVSYTAEHVGNKNKRNNVIDLDSDSELDLGDVVSGSFDAGCSSNTLTLQQKPELQLSQTSDRTSHVANNEEATALGAEVLCSSSSSRSRPIINLTGEEDG